MVQDGLALRAQILDISRQDKIQPLSPFFAKQLDKQLTDGLFLNEPRLRDLHHSIATRLATYREKAGVATVVLGMSGGVDSALTANLFKTAGWRVIGYQLPINQNPEETARGIEASEALGIEHQTIDLSSIYDEMAFGPGGLGSHDPDLNDLNDHNAKIRCGNIRARLRMITLYNMASKHGGIVASTDNFSELGAGFWTLHGDVGDVAPIQGLNKSWEVPMLAKISGVPESTWRATPTDGLGISAGDEAQLGCSYLEWDLMVNWLFAGGKATDSELERDQRAREVFEAVTSRMTRSWFKRLNPFNFDHPSFENVQQLAEFERQFTIPRGI